jgi:hypothetical protein
MKKAILFLFTFIYLSTHAFTIGEISALELISFTAVQNGNKIDIKFSTSVLTGGPYFTIEKSKDGNEFTKLLDIPAIDNASTYSDYFETDYQPYNGVSYYRIKQTDEAGNFRYSQTVTFKLNEEQVANNEQAASTISQISGIIYQTSGSISQAAPNRKNETLLVLRDANGNDYYTMVALNLKKNSLKSQEMYPPVSQGTYHIVSSSNDELNNQKLIVK